MALTTTKFFNRRYGSSSNGYNFWFEVDETATNNIANTSTCDIKYYGEQTSAYAYSDNSYTYYRFSANGGAFTDWLNVRAINAGQGKPVLLMSKTGVTIPHDSDGTKVLTLVGEYTRSQITAGTGTTVSTNQFIPIGTATGTSEENAKFSFSGTVTLTALDRQSTITSVNNINAGSRQTVVFTPHSTSFYYRVQFKNGSTVLATENIGKATTAETAKSYTSTYAFPTSLLPNSTSATLTAVLYTYADSGYSTLIGSDSKNFTLSIASSVVPTFTSGYPTVTPDNSSNSWLASNASSLWISGYSKAYVAARVTAGSGATISSVKTTNAFNATLAWNSSATAYTYTSAVLSAGSKTVRVTVTDSRGRTAYVDKSFTVATYSAPTVTLTAERGTGTGSSWVADDSGTTIRATAVVATSVNAANTANVTFTCGTSQTVNNVANGGTATVYFTGKSAESAFIVTAKAVDKVGVTGATSSQTVSTEVVPFSWNEDRIGVGKVAETASWLDSSWNIGVRKAGTAEAVVRARNDHGWVNLDIASNNNRGIWDSQTSSWMIYKDTTGGTYVENHIKTRQSSSASSYTLPTNSGQVVYLWASANMTATIPSDLPIGWHCTVCCGYHLPTINTSGSDTMNVAGATVQLTSVTISERYTQVHIYKTGATQFSVAMASPMYPHSITYIGWHNMIPVRCDTSALYLFCSGVHITVPTEGASSPNVYSSGSLTMYRVTQFSGNIPTSATTLSITGVYQRTDGLEIICSLPSGVSGVGIVTLNGTITTT